MNSSAPESRGDLDHPRPRHGRIGEGDILVDGAVEQQVFLQHDANMAPQPRRIDLAQIRPVEEHLSFGRRIQALDEFGQRRFARAGRADDADCLARLDDKGHILENLGTTRAIAKVDIAEFDGAAGRRRRQTHQGRWLRSRVENVAEALDRDLHLLKILPDLRQPQDRLHRLRGDHVEGDERPDAELAVDHRLRSEQQHGGSGELADVLDGQLPARADHGRIETRLHIGGELFFPLRAHQRLDCRRLHCPCADDRLDQELLARRAPVELFLDEIPQRRPHEEADQHVDRQADEDDQGEGRRIGEHHSEEDESEDEVDRRKQSLPGQEGADRLQLPHPGHGLSGRARLEIAHRQPQEMREQALTEFDVDAVGGVRQRICAQVLQRDVEQADDDEARDHHEQGLVALVRQHLVDDHLENQRRRQGEDLDEQRRREHMPERLAVTPDGRQEPAHPERFRVDAGAPDPAGEQEEPARHTRAQAPREGISVDRVTDRINQPAKTRWDAAGVDAKGAVLQPNNRRGRHFLHPLRTCARHQASPHADVLSGPYEIEFVGLPRSKRQFALQSGRIGPDAVKGGDSAQRSQAGVDRGRVGGRGGCLIHQDLLFKRAQ